jgi:acyl-CoA synthetase (AMP-forming)/AMP-acid ligase II
MTWIRNKLAAFGDRIACHEGGRAFSYADFLKLIDQAVAQLPARGRQVIEAQTATTIEGLATLLAIAERGHIALPLPTELPATEQAKMRQVAASSPLYDQLAGSGLVLFSSGTSGEPKGMLHHFDALLDRYQNLRPRNDRCLLLLLIDHIGGLDSAFRCLFAGGTLVVPAACTPEAAGTAIAAHQVNVLPASPTFLNLMLLNGVAAAHDLSSIEIIAYGAEAMPQSVLQRLAATFPKAQLQQKFGTSETGSVRIKSVDNESLFFRIEDSDTQWKIVDDILWLKTPSRILGYLNADDDNLEADGWYATGDLVESDDLDNLRIIGRASALINVGGQKVHPAEVEAVLNTVPGITASKAFAKPNSITGSAVACEIVVSEEKELRAWKRAIRNHCRGKLSPWKIPSNIAIVASFSVNRRMKQE